MITSNIIEHVLADITWLIILASLTIKIIIWCIAEIFLTFKRNRRKVQDYNGEGMLK